MCKTNKNLYLLFACLLSGVICASPTQAQQNDDSAEKPNTDAMWYDQTPWLDRPENDVYDGIEAFSQYLQMRDGVKLAVTVYLPEDRKPGDKLPALFHHTRYWRGNEPKVPGTIEVEDTDLFLYPVRQGFAYVVVDSRGTGASFGVVDRKWSAAETRDANDVLDWIVKQPWSNGRVVSEGISYPGGTSYLALTNGHPALKGGVVASIGWDAYGEVYRVGGVANLKVLDQWQRYVKSLDSNCYFCFLDPDLTRETARKVARVDADTDGKMLEQAMRLRDKNFNLQEFLSSVEFADEVYLSRNSKKVTGHDFIFYPNAQGVRNDAGMLLLVGWYDGAFVDGVIQRYLRHHGNPKVKLVMGPWSHNFHHHISPWRRRVDPEFNYVAAVLRFAEYHGKRVDNGLYNEDPIYYFTMGEEKWKSAKVWPLPNTRPTVLYLSEQGSLRAASPGTMDAADEYTVDYSTTSGDTNRWVSQANMWGVPIAYNNRAEQQKKLLSYTSAPLEADLEVTGAPRIVLHLTSSRPDAALHVYLEDVSPEGHVRYVTEGILRLSRRETGEAPYPSHILYRSYNKNDYAPVRPDEIAGLEMDLFTTSYLFKKGHALRINIAGADQSVFERVPETGAPPVLSIKRSSIYPSRVILPVISGK